MKEPESKLTISSIKEKKKNQSSRYSQGEAFEMKQDTSFSPVQKSI